MIGVVHDGVCVLTCLTAVEQLVKRGFELRSMHRRSARAGWIWMPGSAKLSACEQFLHGLESHSRYTGSVNIGLSSISTSKHCAPTQESFFRPLAIGSQGYLRDSLVKRTRSARVDAIRCVVEGIPAFSKWPFGGERWRVSLPIVEGIYNVGVGTVVDR